VTDDDCWDAVLSAFENHRNNGVGDNAGDGGGSSDSDSGQSLDSDQLEEDGRRADGRNLRSSTFQIYLRRLWSLQD